MIVPINPQTSNPPASPGQEAYPPPAGHSPSLSSYDTLAEAALETPTVDTRAQKSPKNKTRKGKPRRPRIKPAQIITLRTHADIIAEHSYLTLALHAQSARARDLIIRHSDLEQQLSSYQVDGTPTTGRSARQLRKKLGRAREQYERARQQEQAIFVRLAELFSELQCQEAYWQARQVVFPPLCGWIPPQQQGHQGVWQPHMLPCIDTQTPDECFSWSGSALYASPGEEPCRGPVNTPLDPHQPSFTPSFGSEASSLSSFSSFQSPDPSNSSFLGTVDESSEYDKTEEESMYDDDGEEEEDNDQDDDIEIIVNKEKGERMSERGDLCLPRERRLSLPCNLSNM